ncbi:MAG: hypothetical protein KKE02_10730 [Alphaproteobacteria bacterium]|nr:hypothetical protein [Alphaproteobacteria bacterium]MBU1515910.1 hypothetical protein [Alphaproteobacteria bacterium]MBU2094132.1 hypothetical protein [Alphaproteobacteria bacterium]MBU2151484.1 hypothetical protein [Alphaproteobacteria bacterium]MBU2305240.1 hypothetical protein [Alphaproteobacteria bacterium]
MLCCGTLALAASLTVAVGRRIALVILVAGGVLFDPGPLLDHAQAMVVEGQICLG